MVNKFNLIIYFNISFNKVIELDEDSDDAWLGKGHVLFKLE